MKSCIVSLNGDGQLASAVVGRLPKEAYIVAVDGGACHLETLGLIPQIVVGDFDSIPKELLSRYQQSGVETLAFPADKDLTDFEIALQHIATKGFEQLCIIGGLGLRIDHSLANILAVSRYVAPEVIVKIYHEDSQILLVRSPQELILNKEEGRTVSLVPVHGVTRIAEFSGVKWPLRDESLEIGSGRTLSNEIIGEEAVLRISDIDGLLLVTQLDDEKS